MRKDLIEKKNELITRAEETLNKAKAEKRELTEDEAAELAEIRDDIKKIKATLGLDDDFERMKDKEPKPDATPTDATPTDVPAPANSARADETKKEARSMDMNQRAIEERDVAAFDAYIRGIVNERAGELDLASNGAVVPTTIANRIIKKVYDICPILEKSTKYNVKGNLDLPYYDEKTSKITVAYASEFTPLTSNVGSFDKITLTGFLAGALTKVSRSLINNSQFNIVDFVVNEMADSIKRFIEHELLIGTEGSVTGLSTLTNSVTAGSATAITLDDIINVHDAVKDAYQSNAIWIMSPATRTALRKLKSQTGYPLLNDDISTPFGTSILGKPVYVSDNMPDIATGKAAIYYGDMRGLATKFNEQINVQVLREHFAAEHAIGVIGWFEFDAKVEDAQKIAKLVMA